MNQSSPELIAESLEKLPVLLVTLKELRANIAECKRIKDESLKAFMESDEVYSYNKEQQLGLEERISELENEIRNRAMYLYMDKHDKNVHPHLKVKEFKVIKLVSEKASELREWLFDNFRPALIMDEKKVISAARDGNIPAAFVEITTEPHVEIEREL